MKKKQITFDKKLSIDHVTIAKLDSEQASEIAGGAAGSVGQYCTATCNGTPAQEQFAVDISCKACSCFN